MTFKLSRTTRIAEAIAEGAAAYLLDGLRDCPHCHHAATLYTRTEPGDPDAAKLYAPTPGTTEPEKLTILRGFCAHCGRESTGLEMLATIRGQTVRELTYELAGSYCEPPNPPHFSSITFAGGRSYMTPTSQAAGEAVLLCVEEMHKQITATMEAAEQESISNADAAEKLLELRELERELSTTDPERALWAWEKCRYRAAELLEERRRKPE